MMVAMLNGWEIILVLAVVMVLFAARRGFRTEPIGWDLKKALFYFLMTLGAVALGCLLASVAARIGWQG